MKIIQLTAENVKKLTAVEITPDGNMVQITGKNGQGKTSILDSIWWALAGTKSIQSQPIRNGATSARIELKLGTGGVVELIVERRFTENGSYLYVKTADGAKYPDPQKMVDGVIGALSLDPLAFMRDKPKDQFDTLRRLVALDVDPDELDRLNAKDFATRTDINRDAKAKRAQAVGIALASDLPEEAIDESALLDKIQAAADENAKIEQRKANREAASAKIAALTDNADAIEAAIDSQVRTIEDAANRESELIENQINALKTRQAEVIAKASTEGTALRKNRTESVASTRAEAVALKAKLDEAGELPAPSDIAALRTVLDSAKAKNKQIADRDRRAAIDADAEALESKSDALTKAMEARKQQKLDAIAKVKMPVDGLSFGDGIVTYNGVPLDQSSDAEQLMVSTAIAAALNPKLRVLRIRDGSLLDDDAMKRLADFADKNDMQVWIERVDGSGTVGFVMEDGHVRGQELHAPDPAKASKKKAVAEAAE